MYQMIQYHIVKFISSLFVIGCITYGAYLFFRPKTNSKTKHYSVRIKNKQAIILSSALGLILLLALSIILYRDITAPDTQCTRTHTTQTLPPKFLTTAMDYFNQANYDYDTGDCEKAIREYTVSIQLDPSYPQAYNNRAYTYMRMRNYPPALLDLDTALSLKPTYIQALMNRADIHNYYYAIDRDAAIADYKRVITLGGSRNPSVCGHLAMARTNQFLPAAIWSYIVSLQSCR